MKGIQNGVLIDSGWMDFFFVLFCFCLYHQGDQDILDREGRYTTPLLKLGACTPLHAKIHKRDRARIASPLQVLAWEKGMAGHPDRRLSQYICEGVMWGSISDLIIGGVSVMLPEET